MDEYSSDYKLRLGDNLFYIDIVAEECIDAGGKDVVEICQSGCVYVQDGDTSPENGDLAVLGDNWLQEILWP